MKRIAISYRILDEQGNDITPVGVPNEIITKLAVDELGNDDHYGFIYTLCNIFNRIGDKILIRHLFPRSPRQVPRELCGSDPDRFSYSVQEYLVGRSKF